MSSVSIQTPAIISYFPPVQDKMAGTSTSVYKFDSMIRGQYIYNSTWTPLTDKTHSKVHPAGK